MDIYWITTDLCEPENLANVPLSRPDAMSELDVITNEILHSLIPDDRKVYRAPHNGEPCVYGMLAESADDPLVIAVNEILIRQWDMCLFGPDLPGNDEMIELGFESTDSYGDHTTWMNENIPEAT